MKYELFYTNRFKKDLKKCLKRGLNTTLIEEVLDLLQQEGVLPTKYKPHKLKGKYKGCWECHIQPDWLLVWQQDDEKLILLLLNTGSHSDIFK